MRSSVHVAAFLRLAEMQGVGQGIEKGHMNFHLLFGWGNFASKFSIGGQSLPTWKNGGMPDECPKFSKLTLRDSFSF